MRTVHDVIDSLDEDTTGLSSYGELAPVYDFINSDHFNYERQEKLTREITDDSRFFVELGCGSGQLLKRVEGSFDRTVGVDLSPVMLRRAAERTERTELINGDVRTPVLSKAEVSGVAMVGRVFSKLRTDDDVEAFANASASWMPSGTKLVFNTFRRQDLVDGMEKTQEWEREGTRVVRHSSTTLLPEKREGLMEIRMEYKLANTVIGKTVNAAETFTLRGYDVEHIESCLSETQLEVVDVRPNPSRSTHFIIVERS